jgi:hypothetical protein
MPLFCFFIDLTNSESGSLSNNDENIAQKIAEFKGKYERRM